MNTPISKVIYMLLSITWIIFLVTFVVWVGFGIYMVLDTTQWIVYWKQYGGDFLQTAVVCYFAAYYVKNEYINPRNK